MTHQPTVIVATLLSEQGPTGVQTHFNTFKETLRDSGVKLEILTPFDAPKALVYPVFALRRLIDPWSGVLSVWWYRHWHAVFLRWVLRRRLAKTRECAIYAQCPVSALSALRARLSPTQRVVMVVHFNRSQAEEWSEKGKISNDGMMARRIRELEESTLTRLDGIVYVSTYMKQVLEESIPLLRRVPHTVTPNFCRPPAAPAKAMEPVDIINVGTLEPRKNQQFLLRVLAAAARQDRRYTLALVGDGPDRSMLERLVDDLGLRGQVFFLGYRQQAITLMAAASVYVHSATVENLPLSIIEAMASGLPVLAPAVGGIPDLFVAGEQGHFWNTDREDEAAQLLIELLESPAAMQRMQGSARERFVTCFSAEKVAARLYGFLVVADGNAVSVGS